MLPGRLCSIHILLHNWTSSKDINGILSVQNRDSAFITYTNFVNKFCHPLKKLFEMIHHLLHWCKNFASLCYPWKLLNKFVENLGKDSQKQILKSLAFCLQWNGNYFGFRRKPYFISLCFCQWSFGEMLGQWRKGKCQKGRSDKQLYIHLSK